MNVLPSALEDQVWHVLQRSDVLDEEMAAALSEFAPVVLWEPDRSFLPFRPGFHGGERNFNGSSVSVRQFPVVRGFSRLPMPALKAMGRALAERLASQSNGAARPALVCTTSIFADVAEHWQGPVVYWLTDLMAEYESLRRELIRRLDRQLCRRATLVCPNSERLAAYLREEAGCAAEKIVITPNAARQQSLLPEPVRAPLGSSARYGDLRRPFAGVIGNLAENTDWVFLRKTIELTPWLSWLFVGSTERAIRDLEQRRARQAVMDHERTFFTGHRPHSELVWHARAADVGVLPYRRREPTYSGSSTRFYEHLAAGNPIIATRGVAELASKEPLLKLVATAEEAASMLEELRRNHFEDGLRAVRWEASQQNTWRNRAVAMRTALEERIAAGVPISGQ